MEVFQIGDLYKEEFTVIENVYKSFQHCSNDYNPLHTDEDFAKAKGFRGKVMYGNILNAFLSCFIGEKLPTKDVIIQSQEISYKNPVYQNDLLKFEAIISGISEAVRTIEFKYKFTRTDGIVVAKGKISIGILL
ncbi:MAG: MaoC/PaaZ C-terminal domain-containing protein [Odoribacter sp.]